METKYYGYSKKGGIYQIVNTKRDKIYVGSAKEFKRRYKGHIQSLRKGSHHNKHLQASFNKYGEDSFIFEVLEVVNGSKQNRQEVEQKYLDEQFSTGKLYNIAKNSGNPCKDISEETKRKISETKKAFYETQEGQELIQKLSDQKRGKTYEELYGEEKAKEIIEKIRENKLIEMNKPEVKENLSKLLKGKSYEERYGIEKAKELKEKNGRNRKGKYCGRESSRFRILENIKLVSPDGKVFTKIEGIKEFAKEHGLSPNHLSELLARKRKTHHNWKIHNI